MLECLIVKIKMKISNYLALYQFHKLIITEYFASIATVLCVFAIAWRDLQLMFSNHYIIMPRSLFIWLRESKPDVLLPVELEWSDSYQILGMRPKSLACFSVKYMMSLLHFISIHCVWLTCVVGCTDACDEDAWGAFA